MKFKMLKLTLFFVTVGLLSSSKEPGIYAAHGKCNVDNATVENGGSGGGTFGADIEKPMTPGNFLFFY